MTGNFRFLDKHFPANGKPPPVFYTWKDKERRAAWWLESNRRKERGNGEDPDTSSLADEIKAAERKHRRWTGNGAGEPPQGGQNPPYGVAEDTPAGGAESPKPGEDPARAKHDSKSDKEAFLRLSKLSRPDYDRVRIKEAEALGIRPATLDKEVGALRPRVEDEAQGSDLVLYAPEPWAYPVDGAELLDEIVTTIVVTVEQARTVALWAVASHAFMAFRIFPRLLIKGPNSECGKSTLKEVVAALATKALLIDNASTAFIFRVIELSKPTVLIDEGDTFIKDDEERRGILDSGHHKNGNVGRIVGDELKPKTFSTYCPMVIVAIGSMPVTIENRSLIIGMVRKLPSERVPRFTDSSAEKLKDGLACKVARFAADSFEELAAADPIIPEGLSNRKGDNWRPLFAVADLAGGAWPELARAIAAGVVAGSAEDETTPTMLLSDLRDMFEALATNGALFNEAHNRSPRRFGEELIPAQTELDRAWSRHIAVYLNSLADRPWANWNHGKGINPSDLARRLKDYGIRSKDIGIGQDHAKGYYASQFSEAFRRYLAQNGSDELDERSNRNEYSSLSRPSHRRNSEACPSRDENNNPNYNKGLSGLSDSSDSKSRESGEREGNGDSAEAQSLANQGLAAAKRGHDWLRAVWAELTPDEREAVGGQDAEERNETHCNVFGNGRVWLGRAHSRRRRLGANGRTRPDGQLLRNAHEDVQALAWLLDRQRLLVPCPGRPRGGDGRVWLWLFSFRLW